MILNANTIADDAALETDLCIIGAGAAGITIAHALKDEGISITVLESGEDQFDARAQDLTKGTVEGGIHYWPLDNVRLRMFGGATNHWEGSCNDFDDIDFADRPWVKYGGWPLKKGDIRPFYPKAQEYVQIGPYDYNFNSWCRRLGWSAPSWLKGDLEGEITQHSPPTRFGEVYGPALNAAPNVRVLLGATALSMETDAAHSTVQSVAIGRYGKSSLNIKARRFVIALGGIENARFLLLNKLGNRSGTVGRFFMDHPYFRLMLLVPSTRFAQFLQQWKDCTYQGVQLSACVKFTSDVLMRGQFQNARINFEPTDRYTASPAIESFHQLVGGNVRATDELMYHIGNLLLDIDMLAEATSRQKFDKQIFPERASQFVGLTIGCMTEQLPNPDSRITLSEKKDAFGQRESNVDFNLTDTDKITMGRLIDAISRTFGQVGIGRVRTFESGRFAPWPPRQISYGPHHMGTTRMSTSPRTGVVDANLRLHDVSNVYVAGSSVFPTGSHVPPTLTIVAFALRLAEHLRSNPA